MAKSVKSSISKKSSNTVNLRETVFRKSTGNRQKAVEFVSIERTLRKLKNRVFAIFGFIGKRVLKSTS
jgi:hypothetical protein